MFGALTSLVAVKATVAQALPHALMQTLGSSDAAAQVLATVCATSAALEFALLPIVALVARLLVPPPRQSIGFHKHGCTCTVQPFHAR